MDVLGVIVPVLELIVNPDVDEYVPPVTPVNVTACADALLVQNGVPG